MSEPSGGASVAGWRRFHDALPQAGAMNGELMYPYPRSRFSRFAKWTAHTTAIRSRSH